MFLFKPDPNTIKTPKAILTANNGSFEEQATNKEVKEEEKTQKKAFEYAKIHQATMEDEGDFLDSNDFDEFIE